MNETAVLSTLIAALFALIGALYTVFTGRQKAAEISQARQGERLGAAESAIAVIQAQNARQERDVVAMQGQNATQGAMIAALVERMKAREDAHAQHREDVRDAFAGFTASIQRLEGKIDRVLGNKTPQPQRFDLGGQGGGRQGG